MSHEVTTSPGVMRLSDPAFKNSFVLLVLRFHTMTYEPNGHNELTLIHIFTRNTREYPKNSNNSNNNYTPDVHYGVNS